MIEHDSDSQNTRGSGDFYVSTGRADVRTSVFEKKSSTVIVDDFPESLAFPQAVAWLRDHSRRLSYLAIIVITAAISFWIGRTSASTAIAAAPQAADSGLVTAPADASQTDVTPPENNNNYSKSVPAPEPETQRTESPMESNAGDPASPIPPISESGDHVETVNLSSSHADDSAKTPDAAAIVVTAEPPAASQAENDLNRPARSGQYTIQVRAYPAKDTAVAAIMVGRLRQHGLAPVFTTRNRRHHILVCAGAFDSRQDAGIAQMTQSIEPLLERNVDGVIRIP